MLNPSLQRQVRKALEAMKAPVTLAVFTMSNGEPHACEICDDTRQLAEELAFLSDGKITASIFDRDRDAEAAAAYGVQEVPTVVVLDAQGKDHGIRFVGIPTGYEFATLVEDVRMVSQGNPGLNAETLARLEALVEPLHIQVFVTPTCPYCPQAVHLAHRLAFASERVTATMVDAAEFPDLADRYDVHAVPLTVINDVVRLEGAVPEADLAAELRDLVVREKTA
jgi:glutaredoxin-like protein